MRTEPNKQVDELASRVIGAAIEVHRELGPGYLESVYEEALCVELALAGIPFERQKEIGVIYKGQTVGKQRLDLIVGGNLILELKAVDELAPIHKAQVISYLRATRLQLGLLVNFNATLLKDGVQRVVYSCQSDTMKPAIRPDFKKLGVLGVLAVAILAVVFCSYKLL